MSASNPAPEELQRLFELSLDMLCIAGVDGYFRHVNPAFEQVLGYSREELLSRSFVEFVHPDDRESTRREIERLARGFPVVDFENRYRAKDGRYRWLAWRSAPRPEQGLVYAVARDITEQKRAQQLIARQAKELARSNADLEQFAGVVSHDLLAPLRGLQNLVEWAEEDLPGEIPEQVNKLLQQMHRRIIHMERLINDLLLYARVGRDEVVFAQVDTEKLIGDVVFLLAPPDGFTIETEPDLPAFDTVRAPLEQVFRNLIDNAIKHHDRDDGTVVVSSRPRDGFFEFRVADDGPGIPERDRARVFTMFGKLANEGRGGTGVGLTMVKRIAERHGGRVWLEPNEPRGTIACFTWPRHLEAGANGPEGGPGASAEAIG